MASTAATVFAVSPVIGADLDAKSSTPAFAPLTVVEANDGRRHVYALAAATIASTGYCNVGNAGSATTAASAAVGAFICNTTGGVVANQYFWAQAKLIGAVS